MNNMVDNSVDMFDGTGTPEVVELIIKVHLGTKHLYDTKISMDLHEFVYNLKYKMHEMDAGLVLDQMTAVYCGHIMEDHNFLKMYNLFDGATVHLSQHIETIKRFVDPALAFDIIKIASNANEENLQESSDATRSVDNRSDDEDIEGLDKSTPLSGFSNRRATRNLPFRAFTSTQLASAIPSVTEHLQPSTSSATNMGNTHILVPSTSTASNIRKTRILVPSTSDVNPTATNTGNILVPSTSTGIVSNANTRNISRQLRYISLPSQLQTMRNMGLTNDTLNSEALRRTGDLRLAIDLVLSGFSTSDIV